MALENTVAKYTVQIVQDGTAAPAVAEFNALRASAQGAAEGTRTATSGLRELRESSMVAREGMRGLNEALILSGGSAFPELTRAVLLSRDAMMLTRTAAMLTGASLGEIIIPIAALVSGVWSGAAAWQAYKAAQVDAASNKDFADQTKMLIGDLDQLLNKLQAAGSITPDFANNLRDKLSKSSPRGNTDTYQFDPGLTLPGMGMLTGGVSATGNGADQTVPEVQAAIRAQQQEQMQGLVGIQKLEQQIHAAELQGIENERTKAKAELDQRLADIQKFAKEAGPAYTLSQQGADANEAGNIYNQKIGQLDAQDKKVQQAKSDADTIKQIDEDLLSYEQQLGGKQKMSADDVWNFVTAKADEARKSGTMSEEAFTQFLIAQDKIRVAGDAEAAKSREEALKELQTLENKVTLDNLTGEARKQEAIKQATAAMITQITEVGKAAGLTDAQIQKLITDAKSGQQVQAQAVDAGKNIKDIGEMADKAGAQFSSGFAGAFVSFVDGTKTAKQAFGEFAASFLEQIAQMIIQQELLNLIGKSGTSGVAGSGSGLLGSLFGTLATGGVRFAADGMAGMISQPTYFPRFNVVGGEAGTEMAAILARPTFRSIGGIDAIVGNAGSNRLAMMNADDLENRGGGAGGHIHIQIDHTPETQARIISQAIDGAEVRVTKNMSRNTPLRQSVKAATQTT